MPVRSVATKMPHLAALIAVVLLALLASPATAHAVDPADYTYEVIPFVTDGDEQNPSYFGSALYVKTDNPEPFSFQVVDPSTKYSSDEITYNVISEVMSDVAYENPATYRVSGGYLFWTGTYLRDSFCKSDGGEMEIRLAGKKTVVTTVECPVLVSQSDYLIQTYTDDSMGFFEKLTAVEQGLDRIAIYPKRMRNSNKPSAWPYPSLGASHHIELSLNKHVEGMYNSGPEMLSLRAHPYVLDSVYFPGMMARVAKELEPSCTTSTVSGVHWLINVTYNGQSKRYGGAGNGSGSCIYTSTVDTSYTFTGSDGDLSASATISALANKVNDAVAASEDVENACFAQLSDEIIAEAVAPGAFAIVGKEGTLDTVWTYIYSNEARTDWYVASNCWVDGWYVDSYETVHTGLTLSDHPTASIIIRNMTYTDTSGKSHTRDVVFIYSSTDDSWHASVNDTPQDPGDFILTRDEVTALFAQWAAAGKGARNPDSGYIFDGTVAPGTPFTTTHVTGLSVTDEVIYLNVGGGDFIDPPVVSPSNATDKECTWTSSDTSVVTVEEWIHGTRITGVGLGTATLTATARDGGASATVTVVVTDKLPTAVEISLPSHLYVGHTYSPEAIFTPSDAIDTVTWSVGDPSVATINEDGTLTVLSTKGTYISATTVNNVTGSKYFWAYGSLAEADIEVSDVVYTGTWVEPEITVTLLGVPLEKGTDYHVQYTNDSPSVGTKKFTIVAPLSSWYKDSQEGEFHILPVDLSGATVTAADQSYTGSALKPAVTVTLDGNTLGSGSYTAEYSNNTDVGTATITITGRNSYTGTAMGTFNITPASISAATVAAADQTYTGSALKPAPTVTLGGKTLTKGTDYTVTYSNNTNAGTATVTVKGKGNYAGTKKATFTISPASLAAAEVSAPDQAWTGAALTPAPTVALGGRELSAGTDYDVAYSGNTDVGTATVTVTGKGNYTGAATGTFEIAGDPAGPVDPPSPGAVWTRLWGQTALQTTQAVVREGWRPGDTDTVILATMSGYHDALAAAPLAGALDAPVVLTRKAELSPAAAEEIQRLGVSRAVIVGGPAAVSEDVDAQVAALGVAVERCYGENAQLTAVEIAWQAAAEGGASPVCIVATSKSYHDALAIAPWAYADKVPIYLTNSKGLLRDDVAAAITDAGYSQAIIVGGEVAIPTETGEALAAITGSEPERLAGENAIQTSSIIASWCVTEQGMSSDRMGVATSGGYHDALAGAALCGRNNSVLILINKKGTNTYGVDEFMAPRKDQIAHGYIFGGASAVTEDTEVYIKNATAS